ncbi:hypothetical protein PDESU_05089 [Pontiella desulfatans]|uniref:Uncharacterized protein n=1 Tax=Pontiella desulfatans TaxID=2750659 RepID=A0A6C2U8Q9_PONDE|nr:hypothetical protein [Pontiella desulfatans]VGO16498.1 hypothetical protein PDESU_05089 [Pontiella desulfatans]
MGKPNDIEKRGAGGSSGGIGQFLIGLVMMCGGIYMLLNSIIVSTHFGFGYHLYSFGRFGITSGMVMIPFMFGVGIIFYDSKKWYGWLLAVGSLIALVFGVISSIQFRFRAMSAFDLIVILVLSIGGLGLFLRSLRSYSRDDD